MIHVSDLLHEKRRMRLAWNKKNNALPYESFYHMDQPFSDLWGKFLNVEKSAKGNVGDSNEDTLALLKENDIVRYARFEFMGCRTKIPVLKKIENGYMAMYPYLSAYPKESESLMMKINQEICAHCGVNLVENRIVYLNKDYVRQEDLDVNQLFEVSDCLFNRRNNLGKPICELMEKIDLHLEEWILRTSQLIEGECPEVCRSKNCTSGRRCAYYDTCFDESELVDDSVLFLTTSREKIHAYEQGIEHMKDMDPDTIEGFPLQYAQVMASSLGGVFCDRFALNEWMDGIQYPISYLDFEWDTFAVPPYPGMKPFDVLCFQYSLHVEQEDGSLEHMDFFQSKDCRRNFIESILRNVPESGSILVYNMEGAEKLRLIQLGSQFPEYAQRLEQIYSRMIDLSKPFEHGLFYDVRMRGHYSLKNVLPIFSDTYSYSDLEIQNGMTAVHAYRTYDTVKPEEKEQICENIRTYCAMDTFAEYVVFHGLEKYKKLEF